MDLGVNTEVGGHTPYGKTVRMDEHRRQYRSGKTYTIANNKVHMDEHRRHGRSGKADAI